MESSALSHTPAMLKTATKENNMILSKENRASVALSGRDGFGSSKDELEVDIQSAQVLDGSSLQLRGTFTAENKDGYSKTLKFNGSAYSLVEQITIEYNGQAIVNLNQDADYIANMNRKLYEGRDESNIQDFMSLKDVDVKTGSHSFCLDLSKYGSKLNYFIATGSIAKLKVRIRFQRDLARLLHGAVDGTKKITGYELKGVEIAGDFMTFQPDAYKAMIKQMESPSGVKMSTHRFIPQRSQLIPQQTNHIVQGTYQYRNVVSIFYLPVKTSITANASGISDTDVIDILKYEGGVFPKNQRVRFSGLNYVNQNGSSGETNVPDHLTGVLKAVKEYPDTNDVGFTLVQDYKDNYQITGASFVRGNDNLVSITNSGQSGFSARGLLENEFETEEKQPATTLLQVGVITSVLSVASGQVEVLN